MRDAQAAKQLASGKFDAGSRGSVTGGGHLDGITDLLEEVFIAAGFDHSEILRRAGVELPGYYRPTKKWDLVVISQGRLVAAIEMKSQVGPSFGNNFNNRTEEALGNASDLWTAYREGAFGNDRPAPWLGWVMMLEDCAGSASKVAIAEPHFKVFPEFRGTSYRDRYQILLRKLMLEKLYNAAAFITATDVGGGKGQYSEPARDLSMRVLLLAFAGNIATHVALTRKP